MTTEQWKELVNYGLPTIALVAIAIASYRGVKWVSENFIKPFLGTDGIVAQYFQTQSRQTERLGDIAEKHQSLTEELAKGCAVHHQASDAFFRKSDIDISELLQIHRHIVAAMKCQFSDDLALKELAEADAILRRHMRT